MDLVDPAVAVIFVLVATAIGLVYYFAPDAEQEWVWLTPGSIFATLLWLVFSLGFKIYVANFGDYNETYGAIAGVIVLLLWFYASGLAILIGAEMNAEIEHASPYGKAPGEKVPGERRRIGVAAARAWEEQQRNAPAPPRRPAPAPARPRANPAIVMTGGILAGLLELIRGRKTRA